MFKVISSIIFLIGISGCIDQLTKDEKLYSAPEIKDFVLKASSGDTLSNDRLSGLINFSYPLSSDFKKVEVDSFISNGTKFFYLLMEHNNPLYNRFAVYNNRLEAELIDRSLNGKSNISLLNENIIRVDETFISKESLGIKRLSLYKIENDSVFLTFRNYTLLDMPDKDFSQKILTFNKDSITTKIEAPVKSGFNELTDTFLFDAELNKYISEKNVFGNLVAEQVDNFKPKINRPQIRDERTALASLRSVNTGSFYLDLSSEWNEISDYTISEHLKISATGIKYINNKLGANIYIIQLVEEDSSENIIEGDLYNTSQGNYKVRYSEKIKKGKNFIQYFEYSCGDKKFLMIFETSRFTYYQNKNIYENIINSFYMDC